MRPPPTSTLFPYTTLFRSSFGSFCFSSWASVCTDVVSLNCLTTGSSVTSRMRSEEHTSELQSHHDLVCRLLLEKKKTNTLPSEDHAAYLPVSHLATVADAP